MNSEIVVSDHASVTLYDQGKLQEIKQIICPTLDDKQFTNFVEVCRALNLNPWTKEIYGVIKGGRLVIIIGIDGYRNTANASGVCLGISEPEFVYNPHNTNVPLSAKVTVKKLVQGHVCEFVGFAYFDEYNPGNNPVWKKMPRNQLAKCAEAQAIRKAFSRNLGGTYINEEVEHMPDEEPTKINGAGAIEVKAGDSFKVLELVDKINKVAGEKTKDFSLDEKYEFATEYELNPKTLSKKSVAELDAILFNVEKYEG